MKTFIFWSFGATGTPLPCYISPKRALQSVRLGPAQCDQQLFFCFLHHQITMKKETNFPYQNLNKHMKFIFF